MKKHAGSRILLVSIFSIVSITPSVIATCRTKEWQPVTGSGEGRTLHNVSMPTIGGCAVMCGLSKKCETFAFQKETEGCELLYGGTAVPDASKVIYDSIDRTFDLELWSEGWGGTFEYTNPSMVYFNGLATVVKFRGLNVVAINRKAGKIIFQKVYDTWGSNGEVVFGQDIQALAVDSVVAVGVHDTADNGCANNDGCIQALRTLGDKTITKISKRQSYALLGYKGTWCEGQPPWVQKKESPPQYRNGLGAIPVSIKIKISSFDGYNCD